jgi:hypothetical protein
MQDTLGANLHVHRLDHLDECAAEAYNINMQRKMHTQNKKRS